MVKPEFKGPHSWSAREGERGGATSSEEGNVSVNSRIQQTF